MQFATFILAAVLSLGPTTPVSDTLDAAGIVVNGHVLGAPYSSEGTLRSSGSEQIERLGARRLEELLRTYAGVGVKDYGGIGGMKTVSIRDFSSHHTSVLYDGMALGDAASGQVDVSRFSLENVGSVSVSIGASDDIFQWAKEALSAGTLRIESAVPDFSRSNTHLSVGLQGGSWLTFEPYLIFNQKLSSKWRMSAGSQFLYSKGDYTYTMPESGDALKRYRREGSEVFSFTPSLGFDGDLGAKGKFSFKANYHDSSRGLPGAVILYTQNPTEHLWERDLVCDFSYSKNFILREDGPAGKFKLSAGYSMNWDRYTDTDQKYIIPVDDRYLSQRWNLRGVCLFPQVGRFSFSLAQDLFIDHLDDNLNDCPFPTRETSYTCFSARYRSPKLVAVVSLAGVMAFEQLRGEIGSQAVPFRWRLSPSAFVCWRPAQFLKLRMSVRDGYRLPTFNDLYYSKIGTSDLRPERALQSSLGASFEYSAGGFRMTYDVDGYFNYVKDKIVASPSLFIWKMRNLGKVMMAGCDNVLTLSYRVAPWMNLSSALSYSYQWAVDVSNPSAKNYAHQIPYSPRHSGNANFSICTDWVDLSYTLCAVGRRYTMGENIPENAVRGYLDHGLTIGHTFHFAQIYSIRVWLDALNLANVNYEVIKSYPMPGRQLRGGVKFSF